MVERIPSYDDLGLCIERAAGGTYQVVASTSDGSGGRGSFKPPISDDELDEFVRRVGLVHRRGRSERERMDDIESLGSKLFDSLIKDEVRDVYRDARIAAELRGRGLRITLRLSDAPELMRLPWEFLYSRPRFLSQSIDTPVVRTLDLETKRRPLRVGFPLKILGMVSSPQGYAGLDANEERRRLENALGRLKSAGVVELGWLEQATLAELGRRFSEPDDIHVLHYIGHGAYDEASEHGILVLETPEGRAHDVSGEQLGRMLQDEKSLRLVVLNSCEGARTSRIDPFSGVATTLVEFDIPAVIAMQFEISNEAAIAFSESLYTGLAQGLPVDAALAPARRAILALREAEFGTPVLFLRAADARLFDLPPGIDQLPPKPPPGGETLDLLTDPQWADALSAFFAKRWDDAVQRFEVLQGRYPGEGRVEARLKDARRQRDIETWSSKAEAAAADDDWGTAVSALENLIALDPDHPDIGARLEQARSAQRRKALVDEMTALHQAGRWDAVVAAAAELARIDPDNPDPGGIVSDAQAKIRDVELAERYAQALNHLDQQHWQRAADAFTATEREHPGYRDAAALLKTARHNLEAMKAQAAQPAPPPPAQRMPKSTGPESGTKRDLAEHAHREPELPGVHPGVDRGGIRATEEDHELGPSRKRRWLKPILGVAGTFAVICAVVLAVLLIREEGPGQGPYRVTATVPVGSQPAGVAVDPGTRTVYVANAGNDSVSVIDGARRTVTATVPVGKNPSEVAVDQTAQTVYIVNYLEGGTVSGIDASTRMVTLTMSVGRYPAGVGVDPTTGTLYVSNSLDNTVSVIDGSTHLQVGAPVPVGRKPHGVATDPSTHTVFVANYDDSTVSVIDGSTRTVTATVPVWKYPDGVAVDPDSHTVYVTSFDDPGRISVIDGSTRTVAATIQVRKWPEGVAVDPDTHTAYVTNKGNGTVSVIDGSTRTVTATVRVGKWPNAVAVDPGTHTVYVANLDDNTVMVIERR